MMIELAGTMDQKMVLRSTLVTEENESVINIMLSISSGRLYGKRSVRKVCLVMINQVVGCS